LILFCGIASEPPVALAIDAAVRRGFDHLVFNQRQAQHCEIAVDHQNGRLTGSLWAQQKIWPLEKFTGVYVRLIETEALPENQPGRQAVPADPNRVARAAFLQQALSDWLEVAECRVVNRAAAMSSNVSKPYQAQLISTFFPTPTTLVTNSPDEAREFIRTHKRVIYKSISSIRSIVREWSIADEANLEKIKDLPTQFQAFVSGTNIRVHVVGRKVFATEIASPAVDYRYAQRDGMEVEMRPVELPAEIAEKCRALAAHLCLPFCGIDLKLTEQNAYYCFEVNPSPAYSYYQQHTEQPIADALVDYLAGISENCHACAGS
jgi:glutathione synthase/RimK-type ligase-like ATP-grasp enzyme